MIGPRRSARVQLVLNSYQMRFRLLKARKPEPDITAANPVNISHSTLAPVEASFVTAAVDAGRVSAPEDGCLGVKKVNAPVLVTDSASGLVTTTSVLPAEFAAVTQVIEVEAMNVTGVQATPPIETVAPSTKSVPVIVTVVPPEIVPEIGETETKVGTPAWGVDGALDDEAAEVPPALVAETAKV